MTHSYLERSFRIPVGGEEIFTRSWTAGPHSDPGPGGRGRAPAIVMVHGIGVSSRYMVPLAERLVHHTDIYALDLPGFGESTKPTRALPTDRLAHLLGSWIDAVSLDRPILLGNSYGCQVAVALAARRPSCARALVLNSPTVDAARRSMLGEIGRVALDAPRERWPLVAICVRDYLRAGPRRVLTTLRHAIDDRVEDTIQRIAAPILIVRGGRDPIVSGEWSRRLASLAPNATFVTLAGVPHAANFSAPDALARAVGTLLAAEAGRGDGAVMSKV